MPIKGSKISRDPECFFPGNGKAKNPGFPGNSRPGNSREQTLHGVLSSQRMSWQNNEEALSDKL